MELSINSILLHFFMRYWKSSFLLHHPIYILFEVQRQKMCKFCGNFLKSFSILFPAKNIHTFFKIQRIKSLRTFWEITIEKILLRIDKYLRIKDKLLLVLFTKHQWVLDYIICFATETNWLGEHYLHVLLIFILHHFYC